MSQFIPQPWQSTSQAVKIIEEEYVVKDSYNPEAGEIASGVSGYEDSKLMLSYQVMYCEHCEKKDYVLASGHPNGKPSCQRPQCLQK